MEFLKEIRLIILHHSQRAPDWPEFIKERHIKRGFEDVGYHYLIGNKTKFSVNGKLYKGRDEKFQGAHAIGFNANSIGICLIGDLDKNPPTQEQLNTLIKFLKEKIAEHKIPVQNILGHRELPGVAKTCPGKLVDLNSIRKMVEAEK